MAAVAAAWSLLTVFGRAASWLQPLRMLRAQPSVRQGDDLLTYHPTPSVPIQTRIVTSHTNLSVTMPLYLEVVP